MIVEGKGQLAKLIIKFFTNNSIRIQSLKKAGSRRATGDLNSKRPVEHTALSDLDRFLCHPHHKHDTEAYQWARAT